MRRVDVNSQITLVFKKDYQVSLQEQQIKIQLENF